MKNTVILALLWFAFTTSLQAQSKTVERTLDVPANNKIDLQLRFGNEIKITAWDKKEAAIKVTYEINGGRLNDAMLLKSESDDKSARIHVDLDQELSKTGKAGDCPENNNTSFIYNNGEQSISCTNINYEIFVPRNADLTVETINGNIDLKGLSGPIQAKSISGFVDMTLPDKKGAAVSLKTITGEVYSDVEIALANKEKAPIVGYELKGKVNGGGSIINLESISNDIFLRKQD